MIKEPEKILFVCTGNYYRSRFAEILFNYLVNDKRKAIAFSRGFEVFMSRNEGPISVYASKYLTGLDITFQEAFPVQITEIDFLIAHRIILMDRTEHEPMMKKYFPDWNERGEYWDFQDIQFQSPEYVLPNLEETVRNLVSQFV
jgi:protein-tyrosine phosphatase